jgi:hypothetical protein
MPTCRSIDVANNLDSGAGQAPFRTWKDGDRISLRTEAHMSLLRFSSSTAAAAAAALRSARRVDALSTCAKTGNPTLCTHHLAPETPG